MGEENELIVNLPYSKERFAIPPNLYIIGTMNTSDKSIAQLDLALRRRFGFIEMLPDANLLSKENQESRLKDDLSELYKRVNLLELLKTINNRIEILLDKDHLIGHSYFMQVKSINDLKTVLFNEVIPLLEEYFYGDLEKIELVLGSNFFKYDKKENLFERNLDQEIPRILKSENEIAEKEIKSIYDFKNENN